MLDNKIVVSQPPDLLVYTDVNRDRVFDPAVDKREVLLTGFNGRNHDHSLHSVTAGPDGLYFSDLYKDVGYSSAMEAGANILRVKFVGTADFTANVTSGPSRTR